MNTLEIDNHLQDVGLNLLCFKPSVMRSVMVAIVENLLAEKHWLDEMTLPELGPEDKNAIGGAMKTLAGRGIIKRMEGAGDHRRSKSDARRGGLAWRYIIENENLARTFLKRNDQQLPPAGQMDLLSEPEQPIIHPK